MEEDVSPETPNEAQSSALADITKQLQSPDILVFRALPPGKQSAAQVTPRLRQSQVIAARSDKPSAKPTRRRIPRRQEQEQKSSPKTPALKPRVRRVPGLDGVRGLAVLAVVLYHLFGDFLPGGYLGVDVFFVLSGFLITSLLVREKAVTGSIALGKFWLRRARRILPAAGFVLVVMTALGGIIGGDASVGLARQFFTSLFFVNNWGQIAASQSYFADSGAELFAHYWSLAIEEQFYVLWPLVLLVIFVLVGPSRPRRHAVIAGAGAVVSALVMVVLYDPQADPSRVYYGTDTHAFGLLLGAGLALLLSSRSPVAEADSWPLDALNKRGQKTSISKTTMQLVSMAALVVVAVLMVWLPDTSPWTYRGGLLVASVATTLLVGGIVMGHGVVGAVFSFAPLRRLGAISFSLYLWHWPVVVLVGEVMRKLGVLQQSWARVIITGSIAAVLSVVLAEWSYRFVETPIRRHGYKAVWKTLLVSHADSRRRTIIAGTGVGLVACLVVGLVVAPSTTRLEADLNAAAAQGPRGKAEAAESPETEKPKEKREMPAGDKITAIGDSVMLAASDALEQEFPGMYIDAQVSRQYESVPSILSQMETDGTLDPFVVLGFGTNGPASGGGDPELLDTILDELGPDRTVIMVTPYGDRGYMPEAENEVLEAAKDRDNVYVADWCSHAHANPSGLLREDFIHPTPPGAVEYAAAIRNALKQWVADDKEIPPVCGV